MQPQTERQTRGNYTMRSGVLPVSLLIRLVGGLIPDTGVSPIFVFLAPLPRCIPRLTSSLKVHAGRCNDASRLYVVLAKRWKYSVFDTPHSASRVPYPVAYAFRNPVSHVSYLTFHILHFIVSTESILHWASYVLISYSVFHVTRFTFHISYTIFFILYSISII